MTAVISDPQLMLLLAGCLFFVFVSGLFSGSETGLYCLNLTRLRIAANENEPAAVRLQALLRDRSGLLFTTLAGTNLANYLAPICLTVLFLRTLDAVDPAEREHLAELYTTLLLTPFVFIFGEIVPKNLFQRNADRLMNRISWILRASHTLFALTGIIWFQRRFSELALKALKRDPASGSALHSRPDMYQLLREGAADGALTRTQTTILERIGRLKTVRVGSVMVPTKRVVMLASDKTREDAERTIRTARYSRMPVYEKARRRVIGVVHILDVLTAPPGKPVARMIRVPVEIPVDTPVIEALAVLQREFRRMAIVTNPRGKCLGIVTVKDLVEELVGELAAW